jgi:flagellar hook-associated protein 1 FlgK
MSLFNLLNVGATGIQAHGVGLSVTAQNVQNANTPGYARRTVRLEPLTPPPEGGGGVVARGGARTLDRFVERRLLGATSTRAEAETRARELGVLDHILSEGEGSLTGALDAFEGAMRELSAAPGDAAVRRSVLAAADQLAKAFVSSADDLENAQNEIDNRLADEVTELQGKLESIGELNQQIRRAEVNGIEASDLRDRRDQLVRDVSEQVPVTVVEDEKGPTLLLGGSLSLVDPDGTVAKLSATPDATGFVRITRTTAGEERDVSALIDGGRIGGLLAARDGAIADARTSLDTLAFDLSTAYNAVHTAGFGLDGVGGRVLFATPAAVTGAAKGMALDAAMIDQPDRLAAATDATLTAGDNRNALALVDLAETSFTTGGTETAQEALSSLVGVAGAAGQDALRELTVSQNNETQVENIRASISGVSVDEETISLTRYQRGYQAALQVVKAADDMLQELLAMAR